MVYHVIVTLSLLNIWVSQINCSLTNCLIEEKGQKGLIVFYKHAQQSFRQSDTKNLSYCKFRIIVEHVFFEKNN